jgi:hypothetical protein
MLGFSLLPPHRILAGPMRSALALDLLAAHRLLVRRLTRAQQILAAPQLLAMPLDLLTLEGFALPIRIALLCRFARAL